MLAYELKKKNIDYFICTDQQHSLKNTSSLSYGHCRLTNDLSEIVRRSVSQLGEDRNKMEKIYSQTSLVSKTFEELNIEFEERSFGIIPVKQRGGRTILENIQKHIPSIFVETELIDFSKTSKGYDIFLKKDDCINKINSKYLVLATGGYSGTFKNTDNMRYNNYNVFDMVKKNEGQIINENCIFLHPFGYAGGTKILIGKEAKNGEFLDKKRNFVFNEKTRNMIKDDNYHEIFDQLIKQADKCRTEGSSVYFVNSERKEEILPCVHYTSGGIKTDDLGRAIGCKNLFAIGECQSNGSKNNGRFPGYPFTSAIVYGAELSNFFKDLN
jgi:aspartate oxidase